MLTSFYSTLAYNSFEPVVNWQLMLPFFHHHKFGGCCLGSWCSYMYLGFWHIRDLKLLWPSHCVCLSCFCHHLRTPRYQLSCYLWKKIPMNKVPEARKSLKLVFKLLASVFFLLELIFADQVSSAKSAKIKQHKAKVLHCMVCLFLILQAEFSRL